MPKSRQLRFERGDHVLGHHVEERPLPLPGRHDVIDGRERPIGPRNLPAALPQRIERLRRRHLVNEVQADEQLRRPRRQCSNLMKVPDLLEKCLAHGRISIVTSAAGLNHEGHEDGVNHEGHEEHEGCVIFVF